MTRATQGRPKAKADLFGNIEAMATKVTGMVIWNINMPIIVTIGFPLLKATKGADKSKAATLVLIQPSLSGMIPPKALPEKAAKANPKEINKVLGQA